MTSINDVLKASKGLPVDDIFAELWGRKLSSDYTIATYTGTLPAVLTGTKAGYLHRYKIYGNTEQTGTPTPENPIVPSECGERTANLFNSQDVAIGKYITSNGTEGTSGGSGDLALNHSAMVAVSPSTSYTFFINKSTTTDALSNAFCWFDENGTIITRNLFDVRSWETKITNTYQSPSNAAFLIINFRGTTDKFASGMIVEGSTVPVNYIPYGYKLPLTSAGQGVDIYLGDDTLSTEEYVDSETGKIYHMVDGVLTPTDPPVQFPQIPTTAGSTTISWAGSGLAPSEVEFEYERRR